MNIKKP